MGCIPPIPDFNTGLPTCPEGYVYDPVQKLCCPASTAPFDYTDPTIRKTVTSWADHTFDPAAAYKVGMQGVKASGVIEAWIVALLRGGIKLLGPLIQEAASLFDDLLTILGEVFLQAQGQNSRGYYELAAGMVTDLLGIKASGEDMYRAFQSGGRQAAMKQLGGDIFDVLASEFANIAQTTSGGEYEIPASKGVAGLPDIALSPEQGVAGAKAFLGYAAGFAIREGNTDMLAALLPHDVGHLFKEFAEDFAKNLGIGRIARLVWKPLVTGLVVSPMQTAMNLQYRPTALSVGESFKAWINGDYSSEQLLDSLRRHGYTDARAGALQWQHVKGLDRAALRTLHATGLMPDNDYQIWMRRAGHTDEVTTLMDQADDIAPGRAAALHAASFFASQLLHGKITSTQFAAAITSVEKNALGQRFLTPGEADSLRALEGIGVGGTRRHLSVGQLMREYEDGVITLGEFERHVTDLGYSPDDVTILVQELLISARRAADRVAKANAAAQRGRFAHLSIAQLETAFADGLIDQSAVRAELAARSYPPSAQDAVIAEMLIKAKLQSGTPPKTT